MSLIDEKTIKEYDKLDRGDSSHLADDLLTIAVMELIKEIRKQNELLNILQVNVKEVSLNLETIEETLEYLSDINDKME